MMVSLPALPRCSSSSNVAPTRSASSSRFQKHASCFDSSPRRRRRRAPSRSIASSTSTPSTSSSSARLKTLDGCGLRISVYPPFSYDASGGGALVGTLSEETEGRSRIDFVPSSISIPDLDFRTTRFLGLPLPPGLRIRIEPSKLRGWVERSTGEVSLEFEARFLFSAFGVYEPPALLVSTVLTTGEARSEDGRSRAKLSGRGEPLRPRRAGGSGWGGPVSLAGVAVVAPVGDVFLDSFLMLPTECLAELKAELEFF